MLIVSRKKNEGIVIDGGNITVSVAEICGDKVCLEMTLSQGKNEDIVINKNIVITITKIRSDEVSFGIITPEQVSVHRKEVWSGSYKKRK